MKKERVVLEVERVGRGGEMGGGAERIKAED